MSVRGALRLAESLVLLALVGHAQPAAATTRRVPAQYPSIQQAISACSPGDTVLVSPGSYVENIWIDRNITVRSQSGPSVTIIDGGSPANPDHASTVRIDAGTVEGFDIRNGTGWLNPPGGSQGRYGGGVFVTGFCVVRDNWIHDNHLMGGQGIGDVLGAAVGTLLRPPFDLISNRIYNNYFDSWSTWVVYATSPYARVIGNEFYDHHTPGGGALFEVGEATATGNVIACNSSVNFVIVGASGDFKGNTVVANWSDELKAAVLASSYDDPYVTVEGNNITYNVGPGLECRQNERPPFINFTLGCNNFFANGPGGQIIGACSDAIGRDGNISVDPEYGRGTGCPSSPGDWCLAATSPLLAQNSPPGCGLIGALGVCGPIAVPEVELPRPSVFWAPAPRPNPFAVRTEIPFHLGEPSAVEVTIYGVMGRKVRTFRGGFLGAGDHELVWDARDDGGRRAAAGGYVAVIRAGNREVTRTLLLVW